MKLLIVGLLLTGALLTFFGFPVSASPHPQIQYATPTPLPDGRIIYTVQSGDTCSRISLLTGVSVEYLRTTNQLNENCDLIEGQPLLIGVGGESAVTPTPGPSPTPIANQPTPTSQAGGTALVCALMYLDVNGDGLRQETEFGLDGGAISLVSADGLYSQTLNTSSSLDVDDQDQDGDTEEPLRACFADIEPGNYTASGGVPAGYNPTTTLNIILDIAPGDATYVDFGAQVQTAGAEVVAKSPSPLLGILGAVFLLGGIGLGIYAWSVLKKK